VLTAHEPTPRLPRNAGAWRGAVALADRVIVHSERGAEQLAAAGVPPARLVRIPHPLFPGPEPSPPHGSTILFFGLLRQYKGVDVLLRAFARVVATVPARLVIAGDPVEPVAPLQALAESLGV